MTDYDINFVGRAWGVTKPVIDNGPAPVHNQVRLVISDPNSEVAQMFADAARNHNAERARGE